jgi:hypothetical protein
MPEKVNCPWTRGSNWNQAAKRLVDILIAGMYIKIMQISILLRAVLSSEVRSGRLDTVRTFSGQRPALGNRTAADFRLGN